MIIKKNIAFNLCYCFRQLP